MKRKIFYVLILFFIIFSSSCNGQDTKEDEDKNPLQQALNDSINDLKEKVRELEFKYQQEYKQPLENAKNAYKVEFDKQLLEIQRQNGWVAFIVIFLGISGTIASSILVFNYYKRVRTQVNKKVDEQIDKLIQGNNTKLEEAINEVIKNNSMTIADIVSEENQNNRIIKKSEILILSDKAEREVFFRKFFTQKKEVFKFPTCEIFEDLGTTDKRINEYDLVILNNYNNGRLEQNQDLHDKFAEYVIKNPNALFLYFGAGFMKLEKEINNIGFTNSVFTCEEQIKTTILNRNLVISKKN